MPHSAFQSGFTLFEVVLAASLLSLVVLGVLAATNGSFMADRAAADATRSQTIARQAMEECMTVAYDDLLNLNGNSTAVQGYTVRISVMQSAVDLRMVEVVVTKVGAPSGRTRLLALRSAR